ncbi:MAG: peptide ABC transporter substrate-binding protein [Candidatus Pacebacteria bacterium]|nr:peptide ABC transporter substrate-binding protein [Candidatus Paceibacterota bacterium]
MWERLEKLRSILTAHRSVPFFEDFSDYTKSLRPGDRFIFDILGILIAIAGLAGIYGLEQSLLIVEPAYGGSLTEGDVGAPRFVNPLLALTDTDQDLSALTYAGLMGEGPDGTLIPVLAQGYTASPDGKTYTFILKSGLKFTDGTPITASDVVFTVNKAKDPALKSPQYLDWNTVTATAIDARTVQFTLTVPYAQFLQNTTLGILPQHLWQNVTDDEFPFSNLEAQPVGDGPFVATNVTRDSGGAITHYDLAANTRYALGRPYLDAIHLLFYSDQSSLQDAVDSGKVESAYGVTGKHVLTAPYSRVFAIFFNAGQDSALTSQAVRQALSVAIDRSAIVKNVLGGYATPIIGPMPAGSPVPALAIPASGTSIASSTSILKAAGWTYATGTQNWQKSGTTLSVTLKTADVPELKAIAEAVQTNWKQLGISTSLQLYAPVDLTSSVIQSRSFQALLFGMVIGKGDDLYDFWDSKENTYPGLNLTSYNNPKVDALLAKVRTETDQSARLQDLAQINQLVAADYPAAFIESPDFVYVVPNDLKGVILGEITAPADRFATVATWYRRTESVWPFLVSTDRQGS